MKKFVALLLCLLLAVSSVLAEELTLKEKMNRQLDIGSGLKGTVRIEASGSDDLAEKLEAINGKDLKLRWISREGRSQGMLTLMDGDAEVSSLQLDGDGMQSVLSGALLGDTAVLLPGDLQSIVMNRLPNLPGWAMIAAKMAMVQPLAWQENWQPALQPLMDQLDQWMGGYASAPSLTHNDKDETLMLVRYEIPGSAVVDQLATLYQQVMTSESLLKLIRGLMTEEEQRLYLNAERAAYDLQLLKNLELDATVTFDRMLTTTGEVRSTALTLPLEANASPWTELRYESTDTQVTWRLSGMEQTYALSYAVDTPDAETEHYVGKLTREPAISGGELQTMAASFEVTHRHTVSKDEDTRAHDTQSWTVSVKPAEENQDANLKAFEAEWTAHLHSKAALSSPTTLDLTVRYSNSDADWGIKALLKTAAEWELEPAHAMEGQKLLSMTDEERAGWLSTVLDKLAALLTPATATDMAEIAMPEATTTDLH